MPDHLRRRRDDDPKRDHQRTYDRVFEHNVSKKNKVWAKRVARCESGGNPNAVGAGGASRRLPVHADDWGPVALARRRSDRLQLQDGFVAVRLKMRDPVRALAELPLTRPPGQPARAMWW